MVPTGGASSGNYPTVCDQTAPCTLAWALNQSNSTTNVNGDAVVINLTPGTYDSGGDTIESGGGAPASVELLGGGSGPSATVLTGQGTTQTLDVDGPDYGVTIENLTLEDGYSGDHGGNVVASTSGGPGVTLDDDVVTGGWSIPGGQADVTAGSLTIEGTTVENSIKNTFGSEALNGAGLFVEDSTYSGNTASGVVNVGSGTAYVVNSTLFGNTDYGVTNGGTGTTDVLSSTITGNSEDGADETGSGPLNLSDSILADNTPDCSEEITDGGYNVVDDGTCTLTPMSGSVKVSNSQIGLSALANNGGPTGTERITASSAAYDLVPSNLLSCAGDDQRGLPYRQGSASGCDAGAYQVAPPTLSTVASSPSGPGTTVKLTGTNLLFATASFGSGNVAGAVSSPSLTSLSVTVPTLALGSQPITVTNADGSATIPFTVGAATAVGGSNGGSASGGSSGSGEPNASGGSPTLISTIVLVPSIKIDSARLNFRHSKATLSLTCETAACSGTVQLTQSERVKVKDDHKTKTVIKTTVLASGSYNLAVGVTGAVTLTLTPTGRRAQALSRAHTLPTHETAAVTVHGGKTAVTPVSVT